MANAAKRVNTLNSHGKVNDPCCIRTKFGHRVAQGVAVERAPGLP